MGFYEYKGFYFKIKNMKKDYSYLSNQEYNKFINNIIIEFYNYLVSNKKIKDTLIYDFNKLSIKEQNNIILKSYIIPKNNSIYIEQINN